MYFITSSGTSIGKTLVTCSLAHQLRQAGKTVSALKPVISGYKADDMSSDTAQILQSLGQAINPVTIAAVSPWRFAAPLAPNIAAAKEGKKIDFLEVVNFCSLPRTSEITLIEGAGGIMSPLTNEHTMIDLMAALECKAILVVGDYLGSISHTLTAVEVIRTRGLRLQAIVVSEQIGNNYVAGEIKRFLPDVPFIVPLPHVAGAGNIWQHTADMTWMLS